MLVLITVKMSLKGRVLKTLQSITKKTTKYFQEMQLDEIESNKENASLI